MVSPEGKTPRRLEVEAQVTGDIGDADFTKFPYKKLIYRKLPKAASLPVTCQPVAAFLRDQSTEVTSCPTRGQPISVSWSVFQSSCRTETM